MEEYPLMDAVDRERRSAEYTERKLFLKRLTVLESELTKRELDVFTKCIKGRPIDLKI